MIEVKGLVKKYGSKTVLDNVSFEVEEGEIMGLLGPNGAGKSTTMNIITGNLSATDGMVKINGYEILESPLEAKKELGYLPELPPLYMDMTVKEYLNFVYRLKKCRLPRKQHLEAVCKAAHIQDVYNRVIKNLSKGYKQRIGIAQALIGEPKVLILDEPTVGLDPKQMIEIRDLIRLLGKKHTVILSSHILSEVQAVCDRVVVINKGKLIANDSPENLSRQLHGNCLKIVVEGPQGKIYNALKQMKELASVEVLPAVEQNTCAFEIHAKDNLDIRHSIAKYFKDTPWLLLELKMSDMSLENIFLKLTDGKKR